MSAAEAVAVRTSLEDYRWTRPFPTRWNDDDAFGHLNNTVYYAAMDTTITAWLLGPGGFGLRDGGDFAVVVASSCRYWASAAFPEVLTVGLRADRVGTTSVSWGLGLFRDADGELLAAGVFTHVFVGPDQRPIPIPAAVRQRVVADLVP